MFLAKKTLRKTREEIIYIYENTGLIKFEDTLLDRQIEDEIFRLAEGLDRVINISELLPHII